MGGSPTTPACSRSAAAVHGGPRRACRCGRGDRGSTDDDLVSDRPGARFGPRAIRAASCTRGPHLEAKLDGFAELQVVDYGDAPVLSGRPPRTHEAIERVVGDVLDAGAVPIVLGGDHGIAEPDLRACARRHGAVGLIHSDAHTDTGTEVFGVEVSHGTPMYRLVEQGHVDPRRYVQIGLRGYWPGEADSPARRPRVSRVSSCTMCGSSGFAPSWSARPRSPARGRVLSVDVDVLDPAFAPGTGTPEPGGMSTTDLLWACRELAARLRLVAPMSSR